MIVYVLGGVRTGSSLTAKMLHLLGCSMGTQFEAPSNWSPNGSYTDLDFHHPNLQLSMYNVPDFDPANFPTREELHQQIVETFREKNKQPHWGIKDHAMLDHLDLYLAIAARYEPDLRIIETRRPFEDSVESLM